MNPTPEPTPLPRYQEWPDGGLDIDTVYTRCPRCRIVATSTDVSQIEASLQSDGVR